MRHFFIVSNGNQHADVRLKWWNSVTFRCC